MSPETGLPHTPRISLRQILGTELGYSYLQEKSAIDCTASQVSTCISLSKNSEPILRACHTCRGLNSFLIPALSGIKISSRSLCISQLPSPQVENSEDHVLLIFPSLHLHPKLKQPQQPCHWLLRHFSSPPPFSRITIKLLPFHPRLRVCV